MTDPKILVTTATGTTGSSLIRQLSKAGIAARGLSRSKAKAADLPHIDSVIGDMSDPASLMAAMQGIKAVYLNVVPGPDALAQIDNVMEAAKQAGVRMIAKLSGLHATPDAPSAIIRMHAEGDARVRNAGIDYAIVQANSFFQNIESQLDGIKAHGAFYLPMGDALQSIIDVDDIGAVLVEVLTQPKWRNSNLNLTGPEALTYHDVAEKLSVAAGKPVQYVPISGDAFGKSLRDAGVPQAASDDLVEIFALFASGAYAQPTQDVRTVLGRDPTRFDAYAARLLG